jgi:hypothetical protein
MSSVLRPIWETVVGLVVDDGQLAIGIVVALVISWAVSQVGPGTLRGSAGWLLVAMLALLVISNLNLAGRRARRHLTEARERRSG